MARSRFTDEELLQAYGSSDCLIEAAERLGAHPNRVGERAEALRTRGVPVPHLPRHAGNPPGTRYGLENVDRDEVRALVEAFRSRDPR